MGADPIGERFAAPAELGDEGLIRHLRISNVTRSPVVVQISGTSSLAHLEW
jgi:aryl-alcohol dehydrogenase-like predicted oxidoreductase